MVKNIDELCDDIITHILSLLTIRDTVRARLSSPRWLNLPDSRAVIDLNFTSVLGENNDVFHSSPELQSKFVKIGNRFMQVWSGNKLESLIIKSELAKEHYGEIDRWIAKASRMKVERIDISVPCSHQPRYVFPCTALQHEYKSYLKQLTLSYCTPSFLDFQNTSWLSNLTALGIRDVPLDHQRMNFILSLATNLVSLELFWCELGELRIDGQLLHLKELAIRGDLIELRLSCPSLELLVYRGSLASIRFVHVPVFKEVKIWYTGSNLCSMFFNDLNIQAPSLEALSITVEDQVSQVPSTLARYNLKELNLKLIWGFDLLSIKYLLNACPCLEVLEVEIYLRDESNPENGVGKREYWDERQHHKLRKVKLVHFYEYWKTMMLARYILRNAVALEEMEIEIPALPNVIEYYQSLRILQEKINPTAWFILSLRKVSR